jgi:hypothetical protein
MKARIKEHHRHISLHHPEKSVVAEQSPIMGHHIQFHGTSILVKEYGCMERAIREAIGIEFHPDNKKREQGFSLSRS